jgi:hypothetical protein
VVAAQGGAGLGASRAPPRREDPADWEGEILPPDANGLRWTSGSATVLVAADEGVRSGVRARSQAHSSGNGANHEASRRSGTPAGGGRYYFVAEDSDETVAQILRAAADLVDSSVHGRESGTLPRPSGTTSVGLARRCGCISATAP